MAHAPRDICVNQCEILFVNVSKPRAIALSRFNQKPLIRPSRANFLCRFAARHWFSNLYKLQTLEKVMGHDKMCRFTCARTIQEITRKVLRFARTRRTRYG